MKKSFKFIVSLFLIFFLLTSCGIDTPEQFKRIPAEYKVAVAKAIVAGDQNKSEILSLIDTIPDVWMNDLCFLLENMPSHDLKELKCDFLFENIQLSRKVYDQSPWKEQIPHEIYLNNILPYASVNERRDNFKADFYKRFYPLIENCKTPGEAAVCLNNQIWDILNVQYSTKRPKADQSPYESIEAHLASCTGLSILLIDVCRSVGIPMRFVGAPKWVTVPGNHSWVEVWDNNNWHFLGAWEPGPLNQTWFQHRASFADSTHIMHSIYATSFEKTGMLFPTVWDSTVNYVHAVNVSSRYAVVKDESEKVELAVRVYDKATGDRIAAQVELWHEGMKVATGESKDELHDTNDVLSFTVEQNMEIKLKVQYEDRISTKSYITTNMRVQIMDIIL
ncbi:MAG: transglutaminase domain-containing protein [Bacteroidales bacterium]|nr:transglutaminase domain-containing protein [Bacteroidales bacterium]